MSTLTKIQNTTGLVKEMLEKSPHLRDDDNKLIANVWHADMKKLGLKPTNVSAFTALELYANGKLTNAETIRRSRQKVQEHHPELRGASYRARQKEGQAVRQAIPQL